MLDVIITEKNNISATTTPFFIIKLKENTFLSYLSPLHNRNPCRDYIRILLPLCTCIRVYGCENDCALLHFFFREFHLSSLLIPPRFLLDSSPALFLFLPVSLSAL